MENKKYNFSILIFNIQSKHNVKSIINPALSFDFDKILQQFYSNKKNKAVINEKFFVFENLEELKEYIKKIIFLYGVLK